MKKTLFSLLLCLTLCVAFFAPASGTASDETDALIRGVLSYQYSATGAKDTREYLNTHLPQTAGAGAEWYVVALCQTGAYDFTSYRNALNDYLDSHTVPSASTRLKYALSLMAAGDHTHPYIISTMEDAPGKQGIMSIVYALHLMNNGCTSPVMTQDQAIDTLLSMQLTDGGWAVTGAVSDADATAMTLQALSPHSANQQVDAAVSRALALLSDRQMADGGFSSYGKPNAESIAQVWIALSALNIDALTDSRFIKNGCTLLDALLAYQLEDGSFSHLADGQSNMNATVQALHAAIAYQRMQQGKTPLLVLDKQEASTSFSPAQWGFKPMATLIILLCALASAITLLALKKKSPKNHLTILLCAAALILILWTTSFESADSYYQAPSAKENTIGQVTLSIRCDTLLNLSDADYLPENGVILPPTAFEIAKGDTVYTILTDAARAHKIHLESSGPEGMIYINGIANLYELNFGDLSGWVYHVNGESPSVSCDQFALQDGDEVIWQYSLQLGNDL